MPYNTRRKSLSLSELGITLPKRYRTASHPSPPDTVVDGDDPERPVKKSKRSHQPSTLMSPPRSTVVRIKDQPTIAQLSPPPSPVVEGANQIDIEGINDSIVVGTIQQLERTGNRPHLVKELGAVLASELHCVAKSANPSALISSRLTAYLHRSWPAMSPCPLAKDLSPVHPRRLYFYLTTTPHQAIPAVAEPLPKQHRIISPSLSSASAADEEEQAEERHDRKRQAMSPSPEVDLSSPDLDDVRHPPPPEGDPFIPRTSVPRQLSDMSNSSLSNPRRGASPQLEKEERDFKQTANALFEQAQHRRSSQDKDIVMSGGDTVAGAAQTPVSIIASIEDDSEESVARRNSDDAAALFGPQHLDLPKAADSMPFSSPLLQPLNPELDMNTTGASSLPPMGDDSSQPADVKTHIAPSFASHDTILPDAFPWDDLQSPETIELEELDVMFDAY